MCVCSVPNFSLQFKGRWNAKAIKENKEVDSGNHTGAWSRDSSSKTGRERVASFPSRRLIIYGIAWREFLRGHRPWNYLFGRGEWKIKWLPLFRGPSAFISLIPDPPNARRWSSTICISSAPLSWFFAEDEGEQWFRELRIAGGEFILWEVGTKRKGEKNRVAKMTISIWMVHFEHNCGHFRIV